MRLAPGSYRFESYSQLLLRYDSSILTKDQTGDKLIC